MIDSRFKVDYNFRYFLRLMSAVLDSEPAPMADKEVNWQCLYDIAVEHSLGAMLYSAIESLPAEGKPQGDFMPYLAQLYRQQIVTDFNLSMETERITKLLSDNGIPSMPVKGVVTKNDYPQSSLRSMCDVDILCPKEKRIDAHNIFIAEGYERENIGEKDTSYRKSEIFHFELHHSLLSDTSEAYEYFSKVWDRAEQIENTLVYKMSCEDTYIFMLEHLASHILYGGAGLRMYMDVYVFLKKHKGELDTTYTDRILGSIGLKDFEEKTKGIAQKLFGNSEKSLPDDICHFLLNSCTFGNSEVVFVSDTIRNRKGKNSVSNGISRIIRKIFPKVSWMRLRFSTVDKVPFLYPFFLPAHWIDRVFVKRNVKTANISSYFASDSSENAKNLRNLYLSLGLEKRI